MPIGSKAELKTRNNLVMSSSTNNYEMAKMHNLKMQDVFNFGFTPSHNSNAAVAFNSNQSPFLSKITKKSIFSRNDNVMKANSTNLKLSSSNQAFGMQMPQEVSNAMAVLTFV